jgi:hypothetical protein
VLQQLNRLRKSSPLSDGQSDPHLHASFLFLAPEP